MPTTLTYDRAFLGGKTDLARSLAAGLCGGSYADAMLILSSVLSSLASTLWPGKGKDRRRFVELWVRYASLHATRISVPLLAEHLDSVSDAKNVAALAAARPEAFQQFPGPYFLVVDGETVDLPEAEVQSACPSLHLKEIREFSYPNVFYRQVRSGYVHEYGPTPFASQYPGGGETAPIITYLNRNDRPFRRIHFSAEWLAAVVEGIAEQVYPVWCTRKAPPAPPWWLDS